MIEVLKVLGLVSFLIIAIGGAVDLEIWAICNHARRSEKLEWKKRGFME